MKRQWIRLDRLDMWDWMHKPDGEGFTVDAVADGQTTEQHREGIDYIKTVLLNGQKIRPILVADTEDGYFTRLDGFKRAWAHKELGEQFIEALVCTQQEFRDRAELPYGNSVIRCDHGGLPKEEFGLFENKASEQFEYGKLEFLYKSQSPDGLRIEMDECVHVHWGQYGKHRLTLGAKDFIELAEAVSKI